MILLPARVAVLFLGMQAALYHHARTVAKAAAHSTITIDSRQDFYVVSEPVVRRDGPARLRCSLVGQRDYGSEDPAALLLSSEAMSWGSIKAVYSPPDR